MKWATLWGTADEWSISVTARPEQEASLYSGRDYKGKAGKLIAWRDFSSFAGQAASVCWAYKPGVTCTVLALTGSGRLSQLKQLVCTSTQPEPCGAWLDWRRAVQMPWASTRANERIGRRGASRLRRSNMAIHSRTEKTKALCLKCMTRALREPVSPLCVITTSAVRHLPCWLYCAPRCPLYMES